MSGLEHDAVNALNVYNRYHYHFMGEVAHFFLRTSSINNFFLVLWQADVQTLFFTENLSL